MTRVLLVRSGEPTAPPPPPSIVVWSVVATKLTKANKVEIRAKHDVGEACSGTRQRAEANVCHKPEANGRCVFFSTVGSATAVGAEAVAANSIGTLVQTNSISV